MKLRKIVATALFVTAVMGAGAVTAHADPAALMGAHMQGRDQGVGYSAGLGPGGTSVVTLLDAGVFRVAGDGTGVSVLREDGSAIGSVPLAYRVNGEVHSIAPVIGDAGRRLTLTPTTIPSLAQPVAWDNPQDQQRLMGEIQKAQMGGIVGQTVGGIIGLLVGCVVGVLAGCFPGSIIGSLIGGVIGLDMVGGEPLRAAFFQFVGPMPTLPAPAMP
ncbi:hypothetical protein [Rhodococcus sp. NPDC058514]|uniref:hypothetical protein n=1 Tax=unclassified Rhodococcus (in: high G+C Gram-positive bacteria) TaxID=192944 RepID=UPI0036602B48